MAATSPAEIQQLHARLGRQNIRRFEIAVNDALHVGRIQGIADLANEVEGLVERQRAL
jgi:hypothetical protein